MADFKSALNEVKPAFGAAVDSLERLRLNGILPYGDRFTHLMATCHSLVEQARALSRPPRRPGSLSVSMPARLHNLDPQLLIHNTLAAPVA